MACSGQTYGIIGTPVVATSCLRGKALNHHVMRIAPTDRTVIRVGYLATVLGHPLLGRPLVKALAFGKSVPELDPKDIAAFQVVRLGKGTEDTIADFAEQASAAHERAGLLEKKIVAEAADIISEFLMRPSLELISREDADDSAIAAERLARIDEHPDSVLRGPVLEAKLQEWEG